MNELIKKKIKGKKLIGSGYGRDVYDLGNGHVLKVAKSEYGIRSNKTEVLIYKLSPRSLRKHLATIVDYGDGWLVMKKYDQNFPHSDENKLKLYKLYSKFRKNGIDPIDILSASTQKRYWYNIGLDKHGEMIVIDYGNFKRIKD